MREFRLLERLIFPIVMVLAFTFSMIGQVRGIVIDDSLNPVDGAAIVILRRPDSIYITGTLTDHTGKFTINTNIESDSIIVSAEAIGYDKNSAIYNVNDSIIIKLNHIGISLSEVVVKPPKLSVSPGKFTFIPGDISKAVNNAYDVLKYVPLLIVGNSGGMSILGKDHCKILINGKEPIISIDAITQMLQASEPDRIKKVEILLQPSIKDQEESSIINIIIKQQDYNMGSVDLQVVSTLSDDFYCRQSGWFGIECGKWQLSANMAIFENKGIIDRISNYGAYNTIQQSNDQTNENNRYEWIKNTTHHTTTNSFILSPSIGASLDLNHNNSIGLFVMTNFDYTDTKQESKITTTLFPQNPETIEINNKTKASLQPTHTICRLNYYHTTDSIGSKMQASAIYTGIRLNNYSSYTPLDLMQGEKNTNNGNSIQLKGNYLKKINQQIAIEFGFDSFYDKITNLLEHSKNGNLTGELTAIDDLCQQQYQCDIYSSFEYNLSLKCSFSIGARVRWYHRDITQYINLADHNIEDIYIMPRAAISLSLNPMHLVSLSYNSSVKQPDYHSTNPISYWTSTDYYYTGNPYLKAEFSHELSLYYALFQKITIGSNTLVST